MAGVATPGSGGVQGVVSIPVISRCAPADVRRSPKSFRRISVGIGNGIHHASDVLRPVPRDSGASLATAGFAPNPTRSPQRDRGQAAGLNLRFRNISCSNTGERTVLECQ